MSVPLKYKQFQRIKENIVPGGGLSNSIKESSFEGSIFKEKIFINNHLGLNSMIGLHKLDRTTKMKYRNSIRRVKLLVI